MLSFVASRTKMVPLTALRMTIISRTCSSQSDGHKHIYLGHKENKVPVNKTLFRKLIRSVNKRNAIPPLHYSLSLGRTIGTNNFCQKNIQP